MTTIDRGLLAAFAPVFDPKVGSSSVGTTSKQLVDDHPGNLEHNVRRLRIYNAHATQLLGVCLIHQFEDPTTLTMAGAVWIPPGQTWSSIIDWSHRLAVVASGAGTTYNYFCDDI